MKNITTFIAASLLTSSVYAGALFEKRKKIAVIDTGLQVTKEIKPYLCEDGHASFTRTPWDVDELMHGTNVVSLLTKDLDPKKFCIIIYKFYNKSDSGEQQVKAVAGALRQAVADRVHYVNMSLYGAEEDPTEYFYLRKLVHRGVYIFVAAGNKKERICDVKKTYPACYALPRKYVRVIGNKCSGIQTKSNYGPRIDQWEYGCQVGTPKRTGTSQATPIALNKFLRRK